MRFIRKHGRVIPIRDGGSQNQDKLAAYKKTAAVGATTGAVLGSHFVAAALKKPNLAKSLVLTGSVLGIANTARAINEGRKAPKGEGLNTFSKHYLVSMAAATGAQFGMAKMLKPIVKTLLRSKEATIGAAKAFHKVAKPYSSAFAEARKFARAKAVPNLKPIAGLLKHG